MNENVFLFYNLYCIYDKEFKEQTYHWQYEAIIIEYERFRNSKYDDVDDALYDCIIRYLKHKFNLED